MAARYNILVTKTSAPMNPIAMSILRNIFENHPGNEEIVLQIVSEEDNKVRSLSLKSLKIKSSIHVCLEILDFI